MTPLKKLGDLVRRKREEQGLTVDELVERLAGINPKSLALFENGIESIEEWQFLELAKHLKLDVRETTLAAKLFSSENRRRKLEVRKVNLLVVDSDCNYLLELMNKFDQKSFSVLSAENGVDAVEHFITSEIDIVLSDLNVEHGDGEWLLRVMKRIDPNALFFIGSDDEKIRAQRYVNMGASGVVTRPYDVQKTSEALLEAFNVL